MAGQAHRGPVGRPIARPTGPRSGAEPSADGGGGASAGAVDVSADVRPWRYAEVACQRCEAVVGVAKFSAAHTSVQWTSDAVLACAEFCARVSAGEVSALIPACSSLRASIDAAVADGRVRVLPP